jgi:Family of unknown function (DUF6206)
MHQPATTIPPRAHSLDIERMDRAVERAIDAGEPGPLRVLGYGEITLVLGWPPEQPVVAVKRLPPFSDSAQFDRYAALLESYISTLRERGVEVVPTELGRAPNGARGYLIQPLVARRDQLNMVLRDASPDRGAALLEELTRIVVSVVDHRTGLDAQASNWAVEDEQLACFDVSTPLLRSADGRHELDLSLFLSVYPWALRSPLVQVAHSVMAQYHDPRNVLLDVASNLVKERLERWLPALLRAANQHVSPPLTDDEVHRYFTRDRRLWLLMQWLRRADRAWQRTVRRRTYPFLLPPPYHYGRQELPESEAP